ncbi:MAG: fructose-bisphosphate aldolase [Candidatus Doudnabacteria bacterium RIFCSPHIGHO2_01_FULL_49_9]|uniref:Probable fructose-bisphosphate aldolase class 1 n=1 Tax=Candidatus Doudnabacteria bacterium RIFCSPHIGHO2_01_FULL_49_9 TaxID=1817827 RepID=A0A1F5P283_9BACT|nr:MAG: fructose-bisphosphate aldolase [Candidatus Doudnabacteria bacterium RIFCSPHIGHO2_01_FULL_49_9]
MLDQKQINELNSIAKQMVVSGKGLLAADESMGSIEKKFAKINIPSTEENRQVYRDMFFTTPGMEEFISGVILFDETIRQNAVDGTPFVKLLQSKGVLPGIKVDQGLEPMTDSPDEKVTKGLDGLADRLKEYAALGAKFSKWRVELAVSDVLPTDKCIQENNRRLAQYAKLSQEAGIVPMVEPEVMMNGENTMERCAEVSERVLTSLFEELEKAGVALEGTILKTNMAIPGQKSGQSVTPDQIAEATLRVYNKTVPKNLLGIVFLSGGQSSLEATANLSAVSKQGKQPWPISFSFGRALQDDALKTWLGKPENMQAGQKAFYHRAKMNSMALLGKYSDEMEKKA